MASTRNQTIIEVTESYIKSYKASGREYDPALIESDLLAQVNAVIEIENTQLPKGQKWKYLENLTPSQISRVILSFHPVRRIAMAGLDNGTYDTNNCLLAVYCSDGDNEGTYDNNESTIKVFDSHIPMAIKCAEISVVGKSIYTYDGNSKVAKAYESFTKEVIELGEKQRIKNEAAIGR